MLTVSAAPLGGLPEVGAGADLAGLLAAGAETVGGLRDGDILVVAHKVVSKAEGRVRHLSDVRPGEPARRLAAEQDKDPRHVQVVLDEAADLVRAERGVLICRTRHGFVCANAGVDASNAPTAGTVVLLPEDPDASARRLRARLRDLTARAPAVLVTDSFGRAWRGRPDAGGRTLRATWIAVADQVAAAADLARAKDSREPAVVVRGLERHVTVQDGPGAAALLRGPAEDLFR